MNGAESIGGHGAAVPAVPGFPLAGCLFHLLRHGSYRSIKRGMARLRRAGCRLSPRQMVLVLDAEIHWAAGEHEAVREIARVLIRDYDSSHGYYFLAHSHHVAGDRVRAMERLETLVNHYPKHVDGHCMYSRCAAESGEIELAWTTLEGISRRVLNSKVWSHLALLVENRAGQARLLRAREEAIAAIPAAVHHRGVIEAVATAALRCGDFESAKSVWREHLPAIFAKRRNHAAPAKSRFTNCRAATALLDLQRALAACGVEMFLVSGTLLGCIREGRLLGHDKDIDVGVWDDVPPAKLHDALHGAGLFDEIPSRSGEIVRVRHVNGIPIDIFRHFREPENCWHGGVKMRWHNTPFTLRPVPFLGGEFLIPADHELYLSENYGDWRTPKTVFDSAFDTPNGVVVQPDEFLVHVFKSLAEARAACSTARVDFYLDRLAEMGESGVVATCRRTSRISPG